MSALVRQLIRSRATRLADRDNGTGHPRAEGRGSPRLGGFATVYRSWQLAVGREVAVKVDNRVLLSERDRRRFFREVTAAGRLSGHPHVIDVYDAGTLDDGRPYLVMELCPAGSLNDALRRHGPMSGGPDPRHRYQDRRRARRGAHCRDPAPRHQACEHPGQPVRHGRALRLRPGLNHRRQGRADRLPRRAHAGVLRAGELPRRSTDRARGYLLPGGHPVRAADRPPAQLRG